MGHHVQLVEGVSSGVGVSAVIAAVYHASVVFMREHVPGGKILYRAAGACSFFFFLSARENSLLLHCAAC